MHRRCIPQVLEAAPDGAARDAGGARRRRHAARPGAVRLRGHIQSPRSLIKRRTNGFEPQRNGFLVDHPTTLSGSCRGENRPTPQGSGRRAYFWASPNQVMRVLMFDDDPELGRLVVKTAEVIGMDATAIGDATAFRQALQSASPQI